MCDDVLVVSIDTIPTFKARLVPHEVIPTISPLSHYVIIIHIVYFLVSTL